MYPLVCLVVLILPFFLKLLPFSAIVWKSEWDFNFIQVTGLIDVLAYVYDVSGPSDGHTLMCVVFRQVASPMSSSTVSEDVDILRQRLGSPMPEEFYETVMAKSRETRENHYSNELFEHAREYLSHMLSQEGSTDGVQKEIESPFSFPGGEDAGPSAIAQLADFSMQGSENMPEIANNLKSASPEVGGLYISPDGMLPKGFACGYVYKTFDTILI